MTIDIGAAAIVLQIVVTIIGFLGVIWKIAKNQSDAQAESTATKKKVDEQAEEIKKIQSLCANCFMKDRVSNVEKENERMDREQIRLRTQIPEPLRMQLIQLPTKLDNMSEQLGKLTKSTELMQKDINKIQICIAKEEKKEEAVDNDN